MKLYWLLALALAACTKPNPAVCCLDQSDCDEVGLSEVRECNPGLACVDHQCELPSCAMTGCMAAMPVCNVTTDVCEGCMDSSECSKFADTDVCDAGTGACVECVAPSDCGPVKPVCDANSCRGCSRDSECASGACGDDGACVSEAAIVYLDPGGTDTGTCPKSAPCRTLSFGVPKTSQARNHIVMKMGGYVEAGLVITPSSTTARPLAIHGWNSSLSFPVSGEGTLLDVSTGVRINDLEVFAAGGDGIHLAGADAHVLEHVTVHRAYRGIFALGAVTLRDVHLDDNVFGIDLAGTAILTLDGAVISGGTTAVNSSASVMVTISNLLAYKSSARAIELPLGRGTIAFSTIADSGADMGDGARAVVCSTAVTVTSSIVWAPGATARVPIQGCNLTSTIAGPTSAAGAMNVDPSFVNAAAADYHLAPNSPARDAVDMGPATDFEGDSRPQGTRFDIGADEAK